MKDFLPEAKKAYWRAGLRKTPAFRDKLRSLLLEKLAQAGDITEDDIAWAEARVQELLNPMEYTPTPINPDAKDILEFLDNDDFDPGDARYLALNLRDARSNRAIEDAMRDLDKAADTHGVESVDQEGLYVDSFWSDTRAIYINVGDMYAPTIIYDTKEKVFYFESLGDYLEFVEPRVWEIPYSMEDESGGVMTLYVSVEADTKEDAIEHFVYMVESGDVEIWGDDPDFDPSVETAEGRNTKPENQLWYISGMGEDEDETLIKSVSFRPTNIKQVAKDEGRGEVVSAY